MDVSSGNVDIVRSMSTRSSSLVVPIDLDDSNMSTTSSSDVTTHDDATFVSESQLNHADNCWTCLVCTFNNPFHNLSCDMCGSVCF